MQCNKWWRKLRKLRWALTLVVLYVLWYFGRHRLQSDHHRKWRKNLSNQDFNSHMPSPMSIPPPDFLLDNNKCRMETCFNFTKCKPGKPFKVYTYPDEEYQSPSKNYAKILDRIRNSHYHTTNPEEACLFVPSIDIIDRDELSEKYVPNLQSKISRLHPYWNEGTNHLIFNLFK